MALTDYRKLFSLEGQAVLVTGAAQGLGFAIASACAAHGAHVALADIDLPGCRAAATRLQAQGPAARAFHCDMGDPAGVARLAAEALAWQGKIDTLVCCAGIQGPAGRMADIAEPDWRRVFDVNLHGAAQLANLLAPGMAARSAGSIILLSSIAGLRGNGAIGAYGMSKAALAQLARNLAVEWGPSGVRANAISPGLIRTPLAEQLLDNAAFMQRRLAMTPSRRAGEPHEIAGIAVMLASAAGAFINGQNIVADGGTLISDGS